MKKKKETAKVFNKISLQLLVGVQFVGGANTGDAGVETKMLNEPMLRGLWQTK